MNTKNKKRTVITGIAPLCSIGIGKEAVWDSVVKERTHVVEDRFLMGDEPSEAFYFHRMDGFDISSFGFDAKTLEWITQWKQGYIDMDLMYLAAAVKAALTDSRLKYDPGNNDIGLVLTHENPGLENLFERVASLTYDYLQNGSTPGNRSSTKGIEQKIKKKDALEYVYSQCEILGYDTQTFMYLFFVAKLFSIHGFSLFLNNACAAGLYALEVARQQILLGRCPVVIVAGADRPRMAYKHLWFKNNNLYASDGLIKPFCKDRNGFVFGDAATGLVLEDYEHAKARGASFYGEYLGGGFNLECGKVTLPDVTADYYSRCVEAAVKNSGVDKDGIDLIVPHGIGTSITDLHEARTISSSFANISEPPLVTAFKPYFGHNLGGCALLETALLLLAMNHDYVPRTLNCEPVDPKINLNLAIRPVSKPLRIIMKMSCGFAGYNGVSIFRKIE
jgi:3-oxoacyl-(acyl-carrier-protein) synthase